MKAEIITIGDEILIGQIIDSNSAWIAQQLKELGIKIYQITSISDSPEHIKKALHEAENRADIIIITGGLGPTKDDLTKTTLAEYFNTKLVFNKAVFEKNKALLGKRNIKMNELNTKQAELPENCIILNNSNGTAQGMLFEKDNKTIVSLPGVPFEMKKIITDEFIPFITKKYKTTSLYHKTVMTQGVPESELSMKIENWENSLPKNIKLAYLPKPGIVRLRLTGTSENKAEIAEKINAEIEKLKKIIPDNIFGYDDISLEEVIKNIFTQKNKTLATAESCTGGNIANLLTSISGSSAYFKGGIVAYSNEIKNKILGVNNDTLNKFGAVSKQVVEEMAKGAIEKFNSDYSIAVSGIAGPTGGTPEKPVGTTWIAIANKTSVNAYEFRFGEHRGRNVTRATLTALNLLRLKILAD